MVGLGEIGVDDEHVAGRAEKRLEIRDRRAGGRVGQREAQDRLLPRREPGRLEAHPHACDDLSVSNVTPQIG